MKIILARHCETEWNATGRIQGHSDIPLNETGKEQTKRLVRNLSDFRIAKKYCSDLVRAVETARAVPSDQPEPVLDQRLRECRFGSIEGITRDAARQLHGQAFFSFIDYNFHSVGGESREQVLQRHIESLNEVLEEFRGSNAQGYPLIVGHGRSLGTLLAHLGEPYLLEQGSFQIIRYPKF